jgi:hypothetical protein
MRENQKRRTGAGFFVKKGNTSPERWNGLKKLGENLKKCEIYIEKSKRADYNI